MNYKNLHWFLTNNNSTLDDWVYIGKTDYKRKSKPVIASSMLKWLELNDIYKEDFLVEYQFKDCCPCGKKVTRYNGYIFNNKTKEIIMVGLRCSKKIKNDPTNYKL